MTERKTLLCLRQRGVAFEEASWTEAGYDYPDDTGPALVRWALERGTSVTATFALNEPATARAKPRAPVSFRPRV